MPISKRDCRSRYLTTQKLGKWDWSESSSRAEKAPGQMSLTNGSLQKLVEGLPSDVVTLETGKLSETLQEDVTDIKVHDLLVLSEA